MIKNSNLSIKTVQARSTMNAKDLKLIDSQVKYLLDKINKGLLTKTQALTKTHSKVFIGGKFSWIKFITLRDMLKR